MNRNSICPSTSTADSAQKEARPNIFNYGGRLMKDDYTHHSRMSASNRDKMTKKVEA